MSLWVKGAIFVGGMLASTVGVKILSSKTAKSVYTHTTAAALRCKDGVMKGMTKVREGCDDILADAKELNEEKEAEESAEIIEDTSVIPDTAEAAETVEEAKPDEV